jgi:ribosomal protein S18 acetylase RimI-like enzyme
MNIRPFAPSDREYAAVADVAAAYDPDMLGDYEYADAERILELDRSFAHDEQPLWRFVAEEQGQIVGYAQLFHIPWLRAQGYYWSAIRVHPAYTQRGIGAQLGARAWGELQRRQATATWLEVHEQLPAIAAHVERQGFHELFRSWPFALDVANCDPQHFQAALDRTSARGIAITTLAQELERDSSCLTRLYDLHVAITRDIPIPGQPHPAPGFDWFERYALRNPFALPEAYFIAKDGSRYVGESFLQRVRGAPAELSQRVTGIDSQYRGHGIAMALKLATIAYAREQGYARITTGVESNNPGMLAINTRLGFTQGQGVIVFERLLAV